MKEKLIIDIATYWTNTLLENGIRLDKSNDEQYPWSSVLHPWLVSIIHMGGKYYTEDTYKINFNLECSEIIDYEHIENVMLTENTLSSRGIGTIGYNLTKEERLFVENFFKGEWLEYLDIQGSRIIVQFHLDKYYPVFRQLKIRKIKNNILSL